ncbi:putative E3 ubiquitin-protein ligase [Nymphaea thermarum]|nr:putative E3 ubiquitin-protein ligase [Nymphaea thermarum]
MQGQRSTANAFLEAFDLENGSNSRDGQEICWSNMTNSGSSQNLHDYLLPSSDRGNMAHIDAVGHSRSQLNRWDLVGSSTRQPTLDHAGHDVKMDDGWDLPLAEHALISPSLLERQVEQSNVHSLESVTIGLHNSLPNEPLDHRCSNLSPSSHISGRDTGLIGSDVQPLIGGCRSHECTASSSIARPIFTGNSADPGGSSSGTVGNIGDNNNSRSGCSTDGRHLFSKRKRLECEAGQSSLGEDSSLLQGGENIQHVPPSERNETPNGSMPPPHSLNVNPIEGELSPALCTGTSGSVADCPYLCIRSGAESSQRSVRMRLDPTDAPESSRGQMLSSGSSSRSYYWPPNSSSSGRSFPSSRHAHLRSIIATTSSPHNHSSSQHLHGVHQNLHSLRWNGGTNLRIGTSSSSPGISGEESSVSGEGANLRALSRSISEHLNFAPAPAARCFTQDQVNSGSTSGNVHTNTSSTSRAGSGSAPSHSTAGWVPSQNPLPPLPHWISRVQRSLVPSSDSDFGAQSSAFPPSASAPTTSSAESVLPSAAGIQRHPHHYLRSSFLLDRADDGVLGAALSMRNLQGANEGQFRLELLALEERIGNVSTGLSEETIIKCLKKRKYDSAANNEATEVEPCCICQEEYVDEEDLGILECGHDFHTGCIMQWLVRKNLCPICKTTALVTTTTSTTCSDV